jgi:hypothetical protein
VTWSVKGVGGAEPILTEIKHSIFKSLVKENLMSAKEANRKEMEVELEVAQVKLKMLRALTASLKLEDGNEHARIIDSAELKVVDMRTRLRKLDRAQGNTWQQVQNGVEEVWAGLQITLNDAHMGFGVKQ